MNIVESLSNDSLDRENWANPKPTTTTEGRNRDTRNLFFNDSSSSISGIRSRKSSIASTIKGQNIIPTTTSANRQLKRFYEDESSGIFVAPKLKSNSRTVQRSNPSRIRDKSIRLKQNISKPKRGQHLKSNDKKIGPWEFNKFIKKEFNKEPLTEEIQWKTINRPLADSIMQLVEENTNSALDDVFHQYDSELQHITNSKHGETDKIYNIKQQLLNEILDKMHKKLRDSQFPSKFRNIDLDVETIVSKRAHIQQRYEEEMKNIENIEIVLQQEKEKLSESKRVLQGIKQNKEKNLNGKLLKDDLHPILIPAIQNAYGMIGSTTGCNSMSNDKSASWKMDVADMNLEVPVKRKVARADSADVLEATEDMPALDELTRVRNEFCSGINTFLDNGNLRETLKFFKHFDK
ncbi:similar to Saccharomyces cerevisiae YGR179C OKP1 Outer kinetochore protein, required for accurate mitotic chromosome segregation [Maudiozyma barnettii]|uniref:Similar to Saccharomyces cerevisiae YGR179C OKP1 Outer kinetochore protein, required for accurate mitotic chromosome segregation n=1 Tax=Maudiozyma barnettii TaxID=61262 RepID=A0A8H2VI07_9SACH|nr:Okp1p [Kazachstania barnettii]CAB4255760.1 similar to Saccharomyces cerevisiae YGR179C OKP1 Outer kinetochore protein, required for accurate mitotic chromosome segregation [Kazachstania barnettii]CAD1784321.1 similar to Saccharomyces cerevisiae YGR179C OKP1 Outer kinetochore protein, required for accurate mitotic chromosome segregation [Kazachstania barnettii]